MKCKSYKLARLKGNVSALSNPRKEGSMNVVFIHTDTQMFKKEYIYREAL